MSNPQRPEREAMQRCYCGPRECLHPANLQPGYQCAVVLAALPPTPTPGWQPMDSAPKDGTRVLLWWPYWNHTRPLVGYWAEGDWHASERLEGSSEQPQGWQPLPPAPTGERE
jgi:hypothetical protein